LLCLIRYNPIFGGRCGNRIHSTRFQVASLANWCNAPTLPTFHEMAEDG
jgi:hypothetical protein